MKKHGVFFKVTARASTGLISTALISTAVASTAIATMIAITVALPSAWALDYNTVCGANTPQPQQTGTVSDPLDFSQSLQQKNSDCLAAQAAESAVGANKSLATVWTAVTADCATVCATAFFIHSLPPQICFYPGVGALAYDMFQSGQAKTLLQGGVEMYGLAQTLGGTVSNVINKTEKQAGDWISKTLNGSNHNAYDACFAVPVTAYLAEHHSAAAKNYSDIEQQALQQAAALQGNPGSLTTNGSLVVNISPGSDPQSPGSGTIPPLGTTTTTPPVAVAKKAPSPCTALGSSPSTGAITACAVSANPAVKGIVGNPGFATQLSASTGKDLGQIYAQGGLSSGDIMNAAQAAGGAAVPASQIAKTTAALDAIQAAAAQDSGAAYAKGTAAPTPNGADPGGANPPNIADLLAEITGHGKDGQPVGNGLLEFGSKLGGRNPASMNGAMGASASEDPTISLFTRVTARYGAVSRRLLSTN